MYNIEFHVLVACYYYYYYIYNKSGDELVL